MYGNYNNGSNTPFVYIETAYSAMQAAILFYDGLRTRSQINENILTQMVDIKDTIRMAIIDRGSRSQVPIASTIDNLVAPLRQLTSVLMSSSTRPSFSYGGGMYSLDETTDQLVEYLNNAERWLQAARSMSVNAQTFDDGL
ncbi:hypothetical protein Clacol_002910 [Clathrus columnatus]|uniref:Uncharacterized protein n=1 Tax=Clathrus columnatus TaxID=1419009 RepID=A0AAV5A801_9AGAM|nr:hypothetical protein Clacol_002910 [Clathrus columnatus]